MTVRRGGVPERYLGLSGDVKPTDAAPGSSFYETDTGAVSVYSGAAWVGVAVPTTVGATDHGALTGLTDDDHAGYVLADGSRAFTGAVTMEDDLQVDGLLAVAEFVELTEMAAPSAPAANKARLYVEDSGGKTRLMVRFPSGASQQLAIEL